MCGRYQFTLGESDEMRKIAESVNRRYQAGAWTPGEISPAMPAPVLLDRSGGIWPKLLAWGYRGQMKLIINARAETAAERPMFREGMERMRCVVPSSGFFEWDRQRRKYLFTLPREGALYMAGLYESKGGRLSFVILTTDANDSMREVHHRMPLVLTREQIASWLTEPGAARELLRVTPPLLERVPADEQMSLW